jgi:hypothetical protein
LRPNFVFTNNSPHIASETRVIKGKDMLGFNVLRPWVGAATAALFIATVTPQNALAQVCPFDNGGSTLANDGLVLTRYALGIRGAPMLANTSFAVADASSIESNIACPSCGLRVTDDKDAFNNPIFTVADATIISRKLAGFSGDALTNGISSLGSGSRNTPAAVQSFLLAGCGVSVNGWVQGGNAFGAPGVIGTADAQPLTVRSGGGEVHVVNGIGDGLRVSRVSNSVNVVNGASANSAEATITGATIAGGGVAGFANTISGDYATISGGNTNTASAGAAVVSGGSQNSASGAHSVVPGGRQNAAGGEYSFAAGFRAKAVHDRSFVWSANNNNLFPDRDYTSPGPYTFNVYAGNAINAYSDGQVNIGAGSGLNLNGNVSMQPPSVLNFGQAQRQMINLFGTSHAMGINAATVYARSSRNFCWFVGGSHADGECASGGGQIAMSLTSNGGATFFRVEKPGTTTFSAGPGAALKIESNTNATTMDLDGFLTAKTLRLSGDPLIANTFSVSGRSVLGGTVVNGDLFVLGTLVESSDVNSKENIARADSLSVLSKVIALPIAYWNYKKDENKQRHIGPMAQDFRRLFGLGNDDKTIASMDRSGVALAAIQGLNQKLTEQIKQKDNEIATLRAKAESFEREMLAIKRKLGM